MKLDLLILSFCMSIQIGYTQNEESPKEFSKHSQGYIEEQKVKSTKLSDSDEILQVAEIQPEFPGGQVAMFNFIKANLKFVQPDVTCKVIVRFIVEKDGTVN